MKMIQRLILAALVLATLVLVKCQTANSQTITRDQLDAAFSYSPAATEPGLIDLDRLVPGLIREPDPAPDGPPRLGPPWPGYITRAPVPMARSGRLARSSSMC